MKYLFLLLVSLLAITSTASAATPCSPIPGEKCNGGPSIGLNHTTQKMEMIPQCFPWVWMTQYFSGNIVAMYQNQADCRAKRFEDFGL